MNVKFVKLSCGDEFVCDCEEIDTESQAMGRDFPAIECKNPVIFTPTERGMGIMPYPIFGKKGNSITINKKFVIYMADIQEQLENGYKKEFGGIVTAPQGLVL